jgi:hypothetical protein
MFAFHQPDYTIQRAGFNPNTKAATLMKTFYRNLRLDNIYTVEVNFWGPRVSLGFLSRNKLVYKTAFGNKVRVVQKTDQFYDTSFFKKLGVNLARAVLESHD